MPSHLESGATADQIEAHLDGLRSPRWVRGVFGVLAVLVLLLFLLLGFQGVDACRDANESRQVFNPLGDYPVQDFVDGYSYVTINGREHLAISLSRPFAVRGTKCNDSDRPVTVGGILTWEALDPGEAIGRNGSTFRRIDANGDGEITEDDYGIGIRPPGCSTKTFTNQSVPPEIAEIIRAQHHRGIRYPKWRFGGEETPRAPGDPDNPLFFTGESRTWVAQNVVVVP